MIEIFLIPIFILVLGIAVNEIINFVRRRQGELRARQARSLQVFYEIHEHSLNFRMLLEHPDIYRGMTPSPWPPYETKEWDDAKGQLVPLLPQEESEQLIWYYRNLARYKDLVRRVKEGEFDISETFAHAAWMRDLALNTLLLLVAQLGDDLSIQLEDEEEDHSVLPEPGSKRFLSRFDLHGELSERLDPEDHPRKRKRKNQEDR